MEPTKPVFSLPSTLKDLNQYLSEKHLEYSADSELRKLSWFSCGHSTKMLEDFDRALRSKHINRITKLKMISLEGLDGVGKTTIIKAIDSKGVRTERTPGGVIDPVARECLHQLPFPEYRGAVYLGLLVICAVKWYKTHNETRLFFVDRWVASTYAYAAAEFRRKHRNDCKTEPLGNPSYLPTPQMIIYVSLDEDERLKRLKGRGDGTPEEFMTFNDSYIHEEYQNTMRITNTQLEVLPNNEDLEHTLSNLDGLVERIWLDFKLTKTRSSRIRYSPS